jgi:RNA polymerase-associated protein
MTLFSRADDPWSHRTRIVLAEKSIHVETIDVQGGNLPEDLLDLNPYHTRADAGRSRPRAVRLARHHRVPRRALPASAADAGRSGGARAVPARALSHRARLVQPGAADRRRRRSQAGTRARKILRDSILASTDVFKSKPYFLSDEFSLVDASIAPILWRLPSGRSTCRRRRR